MKDRLLRKKYFIIFALVIVILFPITYAIYKSKVFGSGVALAAQWSVTLNQAGQNNNLPVIPDPDGLSASYTVNVSSSSDVDVTYSIVINNLPSGTSVSLDGGNFIQATNNKVVFNNAGTILYSASVKNRSHIITFKAASNASYVNNQEIDIDVVMKQVV